MANTYDSDSVLNQNVPLSKVMELRASGVPNNQIIQILQNDGYSSDQIFDAMNQADMSQNIGQGISEPSMNVSPGQMENPMQMQPRNYAEGSNTYQNPMPDIQEMGQERWQDIAMKLTKFDDWKSKMEQRIVSIETNFKNLQDNFDKLHAALVGKIGEYDQNILGVGTEIKAMEKVFQKILPTFTENVSELSRITERLKK